MDSCALIVGETGWRLFIPSLLELKPQREHMLLTLCVCDLEQYIEPPVDSSFTLVNIRVASI